MNKKMTAPAFYLIPKSMRIPFWFFLIVGVGLLIQSGDISFLLLIFLSILIVTLKSGYQLNLASNMYRIYWSMFYFKFGRWKSLPPNQEYSVSKASSSVILSSRSNRKLRLDEPGFMLNMTDVNGKKHAVAFFKEELKATRFMNELSSEIQE